MVFLNKKSASPDHDHVFDTQSVGADLQRQVCAGCGHVSIVATEPAAIRLEINIERTGLFGGTPEFAYGAARILNFHPAVIPEGPRFGERRKTRRR